MLCSLLGADRRHLWRVDNPVGQAVLYGLFAFGWGLVVVSTVLINHFDLFGLRQPWLALIDKPYTPLQFKIQGIYKYVRHPLYVGFLCSQHWEPNSGMPRPPGGYAAPRP